MLGGMLDHQFERFFAGLLAHFFEQRDVAPDKRFQRSPDRAKYAARTHRHAANQVQSFHHAVARKTQRRRNHCRTQADVHDCVSLTQGLSVLQPPEAPRAKDTPSSGKFAIRISIFKLTSALATDRTLPKNTKPSVQRQM